MSKERLLREVFPRCLFLGRATDHEYAHKVVVRRVGADFVVVRAGRASDGDSVAKLSLRCIEEDVVAAVDSAKPARLAREPAGSQPARYDARALSRHRRPLHRLARRHIYGEHRDSNVYHERIGRRQAKPGHHRRAVGEARRP